MTDTAMAEVHVRRARKGRYTGWLVECHQCGGIVTPVQSSKKVAVAQAQAHATASHGNDARISIPRI